jgi:poly-beta-1,6-N-acetyl-D-glucosamine synthase
MNIISSAPLAAEYVVISPVRDEEAYLKFTIESMIAQTLRPAEWIIVNDGSSDSTGQIIDEYAERYPWIRGIHRENRGFRKSGGGVVEAFNDGYAALRSRSWEFIVKMDGDLSFEPNYFEKCLKNFQDDPALGVGGGVICYIQDGHKIFERCPAFHVRGASKIYRRSCWEAIGGFWPAPGWDTMDEVKANMLGWSTRSFDDLHLRHYRHTGAADGMWGGLVKNGKANYICGYHPMFMLAKCFHRLWQKPYLIGSAALLYGFLAGYFQRIPRIDDRQTIIYLRRQQLGRLWRRETIWR